MNSICFFSKGQTKRKKVRPRLSIGADRIVSQCTVVIAKIRDMAPSPRKIAKAVLNGIQVLRQHRTTNLTS